MVKMPHVQNVLIDQERKTRYEVYAYRALTRAEIIGAVRVANGKKKPPRNKVVKIISIIGALDWDR